MRRKRGIPSAGWLGTGPFALVSVLFFVSTAGCGSKVTPEQRQSTPTSTPMSTVTSIQLSKTPPLSTPWTSKVSQTNPWPEYPRPQLTRPDWQNLNGPWRFASAASLVTPPTGQTLSSTVLVPFPIESALSGIMQHQDYMWYRRTFQVPSSWSGRNVQLNFGAVNWQTKVYVNGSQVGTHSGAYDSFSFDITSALKSGDNELIVGVFSPVDGASAPFPIPIGKQRLSPGGIYYTPSSGIWQTVWIEPTNAAHITRLDTTPDVPAGVLDIVVQGAGIPGQVAHRRALDAVTSETT